MVTGVAAMGRPVPLTKMSAPGGSDFTNTWKRRDGSPGDPLAPSTAGLLVMVPFQTTSDTTPSASAATTGTFHFGFGLSDRSDAGAPVAVGRTGEMVRDTGA